MNMNVTRKFLVIISLVVLGGFGGILLAYGLSYLDGPEFVGGSITWAWALATMPCGAVSGLILALMLIDRWPIAKDTQEDAKVDSGSS